MNASISYWEKSSFFAHQDVIIIGAGLMGLWTAYELKKNKPHLKITILEKNAIPLGASTRNAGFACFGSATELLADKDVLGENEMLQVVEMRYKGIEKIRNIFTNDAIEYDNCGGFECINAAYDIAALSNNLALLNQLVYPITQQQNTFAFANNSLQNMQLKGFDTLIFNSLEGGLHSGKLVQALTLTVQQLGVQILYGVAIQQWEETAFGVHIFAEQSFTFSAEQVIFCTNAFTHLLFPTLTTEPARGQIIVTAPIENLALKGTFHYDEGFYYWRNIGNRILLGGGRNIDFEAEKTTNLQTSTAIQEVLENFLYKHLITNKVAIEYRWSGLMGFTKNKQPLVEKMSDRILVALACNGMGVALTPIMAEKVAKIVG